MDRPEYRVSRTDFNIGVHGPIWIKASMDWPEYRHPWSDQRYRYQRTGQNYRDLRTDQKYGNTRAGPNMGFHGLIRNIWMWRPSNMSKPDMFSHWINYWLFNYVGFDRRLKSNQPVKPIWKNWTYVKNIRNELRPPFLVGYGRTRYGLPLNRLWPL